MLSAEGFRVQQFVLATHKQGRGWCILRCITSAVFEKKVNNIMSFVIEGFYLSQARTVPELLTTLLGEIAPKPDPGDSARHA
ncbi:hypothetical protein LENED_007515 [Lentinula edodes]|uniref:Uncharacterized protein n=1 Tax=Lentinula edodes TaxID=5353 RepID=A0A1Q3EES3_LENED|nr:hypothetical protein LENED_007515 [Lentinula edodes]